MLYRQPGMHRLCSGSRSLTAATAAALTAIAILHRGASYTSHCQSSDQTFSSSFHTSPPSKAPTTWSSAPPISTPRPTAVHSNVNSTLLQLLSRQCRGLPARGADIEILDTPTDFFNTLLSLVSTATQHLTLSSLYLGTGPLETQLVAAIQRRCEQQPQLKVHILLDYYRGTRDVSGHSSITALQPLLALNTPTHQRTTVSLFRPPVRSFAGPVDVLFRGRWRELRGVHHMKYYMVDDSCVLSGANLSDTYFTNRQDRYILFKRNQTLVDWLHRLTDTLVTSQFAYTAGSAGQLTQPKDGLDAQQLKARLMELIKPTEEDGQVGMNAAHATLSPQTDTWLFPALQLGMVGVREEENIVTRLIKLTALTAFAPHNPLTQARQPPASASSASAPPPPLTASTVPCLSIATGYMNMPSLYTNALLSSVTPVHLLSSSESANGWHGAKGVAVHVPRLYSAVLYSFLRHMAQGGQHMVDVQEWQRDGWSYHVKGMWLSMGAATAQAGSQEAVLSVVGSTNFGLRSMERDAECSVVIVTKGGLGEGCLARRLGAERDRLWAHGAEVTVDTFEHQGSERQLPWLIRWVARFAREYL